MAYFPSILAGMPSLRFTEIGSMRTEVISFFLLVFLLSAWVIQLIWNGLRRDFTRLPRLTYWRSLGVVALWGLLFVLVLTMISGARELMTPGAWEPKGVTYRLKDSEAGWPTATEEIRRAKLQQLKDALWAYAKSRDGRLPADSWNGELPMDVWELPDLSRVRYVYRPGRTISDASKLIAYEPAVVSERLGLYTDGAIRAISTTDLHEAEGAHP